MPDPMTKMEIEDVLASIRRLVSEDAKPARGKPEKAAGRLVLTPALRVEDAGGLPEAAETVATLHRTPVEPAATPARPAPEPVAPAAQPDPEPPHPERLRASAAHPAAIPPATPPEALRPDPAPVAEDARTALNVTIAELEAAVAARREEWEPDGTEEADAPKGLSAPLADVFRPRDRAEPPRPAAETPRAPQMPAEPPAGLSAATPPSPQAVQEASETDDAGAATAEPAPAAIGQGHEDDDIYLDEDALRELVRDIIRQELQGTLGERITRNVRKLVRAEINRALASRNFD